MKIERELVDSIDVGQRLRPLDEQTVTALMESMKRLGQLQPITVFFINDHTPLILVSGAHRLEAARRLGWDFIDAVCLYKGDEVDRELREIAENLHRAELTALERDVQVARWIELAATKQAAEVSDNLSETPNKGGRPGKAAAAASDIGINERDAQRAVKVASISDEAKQAARDAGLADNRSALLAVAKESTPEAQVAKVGEIVSAKVDAKARKVEVTNTASEGKRLDAPELDNMARAICVGLSALDPIVDRILDDIGLDEFLRQISRSARSELFAVLDGNRLMDIHARALNLRLKGKLDFGDSHDDDDAVTTPSESELSVAPPTVPETKPDTAALPATHNDEYPDLPAFLDRRPGALVWEQDDAPPTTYNGVEYHQHTAVADGAYYSISVGTYGTGEVAGYLLTFSRKDRGRRRLIGKDYLGLNEAKSLAQRDYDRRMQAREGAAA